MIVYEANGLTKYALASEKNYMSLHIIPMQRSSKMYAIYKMLLNRADFQGRSIHFTSGTDMPLPIVQQLIRDYAAAQNGG